MQHTIILTADGSHSLYVMDLDEHYHSIHGAIQESKHVFIDAGLKNILYQNNSQINILEIGFGTGLNALLTFIESGKLNLKINYTSVEAFPLDKIITDELNYVECLKEKDFTIFFSLIHSCDWEKEISISDKFIIHKIKNTLEKIVFFDTYNLIYFDAFAPTAQPELWTEEIFSKLFSTLKSNGCLVTYCAKGEVKRTLKKVGFTVESLPGPPGKREMIRAVKNS